MLHLFEPTPVKRLVFEMPEVWNTTTRGNYSKNSGALEKLFFVCGLIYGLYPDRTTYYTPQQWKGQLKKEVTINKVKAKFNITTNISDHEADAVALGSKYIEEQNVRNLMS